MEIGFTDNHWSKLHHTSLSPLWAGTATHRAAPWLSESLDWFLNYAAPPWQMGQHKAKQVFGQGLAKWPGIRNKKWEMVALASFRKHQYSDFVGEKTTKVTEINVTLPQHWQKIQTWTHGDNPNPSPAPDVEWGRARGGSEGLQLRIPVPETARVQTEMFSWSKYELCKPKICSQHKASASKKATSIVNCTEQLKPCLMKALVGVTRPRRGADTCRV